jgi:RNA recognition motif-containing protein
MSDENANDSVNQSEANVNEQEVNNENSMDTNGNNNNQLDQQQNEIDNGQDQVENDGNPENGGDGDVEQQNNQDGEGEENGNGNGGEYSQDDGGANGNGNESLNDSNNQQKQPSKTITEPEQFRKVFIGGLSYKTDDETLKNYFAKYGELVDYVVMKDSQSGRSRGFGFVTYSDSFMVDELMKNRPHVIDGRQVEPKRATPREDSGKAEVQMTVKKLFIGGLKDNITEEDLKAYFGQYGSIEEAVVMREKETSKSRGFGFVTFDDYDPVDKVILEKHHTINGVNVHAQKALPKEFNDKNSNNNRGSGQMQNNFNRSKILSLSKFYWS